MRRSRSRSKTRGASLLQALCGALISKGLTIHRNELPLVAGRAEQEFQDAPRVAVARFAVGLNRGEGAAIRASGADDELPQATRIGAAVGCLRGEPFVTVLVSGDAELDPRGIEQAPDLPPVEGV